VRIHPEASQARLSVRREPFQIHPDDLHSRHRTHLLAVILSRLSFDCFDPAPELPLVKTDETAHNQTTRWLTRRKPIRLLGQESHLELTDPQSVALLLSYLN
jgi:hypothetical protein